MRSPDPQEQNVVGFSGLQLEEKSENLHSANSTSFIDPGQSLLKLSLEI